MNRLDVAAPVQGMLHIFELLKHRVVTATNDPQRVDFCADDPGCSGEIFGNGLRNILLDGRYQVGLNPTEFKQIGGTQQPGYGLRRRFGR